MKQKYQTAGWLFLLMLSYFFANPVQAQQNCQATTSVSGPLTFCQGDSVILTASTGSAYSWSNGAKTRSITVKSSGKYSVSVTNAAGCIATSAATTVSVNARPVVTINPLGAVSIHAAPITLNGGQPVGGTYSGQGVINGQFDPALAGLGTHTITYQYSDINGCSNRATGTISVGNIPDASVSDSLTFFTNCTYSYTSANFLLEIKNNSATKATNNQYVINWGDGSQDIFGSSFATAYHTYNNPGSFQMTVTVYGQNGTVGSKTYTVFNGSNPSFGVASQGNTNDCAPATFTFDIINTAGNTPSTIYTFQFDDGSPALTFTHANLPKTLTHTFTKSAFGKPGNAFTLQAYATNPCGTTPATVGGIRISGGPVADFDISPDSMSCVNTPITLIDKTDGGFNANASNPLGTGSYTRKWQITPATGWNFVSGNTTSNNPVVNFSVAGKYLVKLIVTPAGPNTKCLADSVTKTIDIQTPPKAAFTVSSNPNSNCGPVTVTTVNNSTGPDLKYQWKVLPATGWKYISGSDSVSATPQFLFTKPGNYHISLTVRNRCAPASIADTVIIIKGIPTVTLPTAQTYCGPQTISFSANDLNHLPVYDSATTNTLTFRWLITGATGAVFVNQTTSSSQYPSVNFTKAGVYNVSVTAINSCGPSAPAFQTITIESLPVITLNTRKTDICKGQGGATLTASGATTYVWSPTIGLSATAGSTVTANPSVTTTYTVTGTNAATGCADTATVTVVVLPNPTVQVSATNTTLCLGQGQTTLTASGADSYIWIPATGLNKTTGTSVNASPSVTTIYKVVGTNAATGCTDTAAVTITVEPLPVVSAGADMTVCDQPIPVTLTGSPANGTWSGSNVTAGGIFTPNGKGSFTLLYTYTNANGCVNADSTVITVVDPILANAGSDTSVCLNSTYNLNGLPAGGTWSGSPFVTASGAFTPTAVGTFTLTYTYGSGSCATSDQVAITVLPLPQAPVAAVSICPGNSTTLTATGSAVKFEWFTAASGGTAIFTGSNFTTPVLSATTTYYVQASNASGCNSIRTAVTVTVNPTPSAPIVQPVTICGPGNTATLSVTVPSASGSGSNPTGIYEWFTTATSGTPIFTGVTFTTPALQTSATYYVQATINGCVGPRTSVQVTVQPAIAQNTISGTQTICAGTVPTVLTGSQPIGGNSSYIFEWESSTTNATSGFTTVAGVNNGQHLNPAALSQTTWFRRKVTSATCQPVYSPAIEITVVPVISRNTISQPQTICSNSVPAALTGTLPTGGNGSYTYQWERSMVSASSGFAPAAGVNNQQNYTPGTLTQTTWFRRTVTSAPCNVNNSTAIEITVHPLIAGNTISGTQTICTSSTPAPLTATQVSGGNGTYTYLWERSTTGPTTGFAPASGTNNQAGYTPAALSQNTWFRRVVVSGSCQSISTVVAISVSPAISSNTITGNQTICIGSNPAVLTGATPNGGSGSFTYRWEASNVSATSGYGPAVGNNTSINYNPNALNQTTWFRRVAISGGCENVSAPVQVSVSPVISQNIISTAQIIYAGNVPAPLSGMTPQGGNGTYGYTWEISTTGANGTFIPATGVNNGLNYTPAALTQTTWIRRVVTSGGCTSVSAPVEITVTPGIGNNTILADQTICAGNTPMALQGTTPSGGNGIFTYLWEMSTTSAVSGFTTAQGLNNGLTYVPSALNQTTWFRRVVIAGGYTHTSNVVKIEVASPVDNNTISLSQTICEGTAPASLTGSLPTGGNGAYNYLWERSISGPNSGFANATGVNNQQNYAVGNLSQTTWFRRKVMANGCSEVISEAVKITVVPTPAAPVVIGTITCPGNPVTLTVENTTGTYEWFDAANATTPIATGTSFITPALVKSTTYYVQQITATCPGPRVAVVAEVYEISANATEAVSIIRGQQTQLRATGGVSYKWEPATGLNNPNVATPMANPEVTTTYKVTVVTPEGCTYTDDVTVVVTAPVKLVNTFSPNGDGINDTWEIEHIEKYPNCRIEIFNRWGNLVFSSVGYKQAWDGRANGQPLPVATYYYVLYLKENEAPISGSVTIIK